jgi:hypothetical protein
MATKMVEAALDEDTSKPDPEELREARFAELRRRPATDEARALVEHLYTKVLEAEPPRTRQRVSKADAMREAVAGFTADLLSASLRDGWAYRPTNTNFYTGGPVSARTFTALRGALRKLGLVEEVAAWSRPGAFGFGDRRAPALSRSTDPGGACRRTRRASGRPRATPPHTAAQGPLGAPHARWRADGDQRHGRCATAAAIHRRPERLHRPIHHRWWLPSWLQAHLQSRRSPRLRVEHGWQAL